MESRSLRITFKLDNARVSITLPNGVEGVEFDECPRARQGVAAEFRVEGNAPIVHLWATNAHFVRTLHTACTRESGQKCGQLHDVKI